jgi:hypothetical protein
MPKPAKPPRQQPRFDPQRGSNPPEMVDLVDPAWLLKALGITLVVCFVCACLSLIVYRHYQRVHAAPTPVQPANLNPKP